jgi:putative addiction module CopG family antidote
MNLTMNVSLSPQLANFVRSKVDAGAYASASEVIREALRWFAAHGAAVYTSTPTLLDVQEQQIDRARSNAAIKTLRRLRSKTTLGPDLEAKDLRDEGRR